MASRTDASSRNRTDQARPIALKLIDQETLLAPEKLRKQDSVLKQDSGFEKDRVFDKDRLVGAPIPSQEPARTNDDSVGVRGDALCIDGFRSSDSDLVDHFGELTHTQVSLEVERLLKLGVLVDHRMGAGLDADMVESRFEMLAERMDSSVTAMLKAERDELERGFEKERERQRLERQADGENWAKKLEAEQLRLKAEHEAQLEKMRREQEQLTRRLELLSDPENAASIPASVAERVGMAVAERDEKILREMNPDIEGTRAAVQNHQLDQLASNLREVRAAVDKNEAVAAEREHGALKGRDYEVVVAEAVERNVSMGDLVLPLGDTSGSLGSCKKGDVVVQLDPSETAGTEVRIVLEAKDRTTGNLQKFLTEQLDGAMENREAVYAIAVISSNEKLPTGVTQPLTTYGNRAIVVLDKESEDATALRLALAHARIEARRSVMSQDEQPTVDLVRGGELVEAAIRQLNSFVGMKRSITTIKNSSVKQLDDLLATAESIQSQIDGSLTELQELFSGS